MKKDASSPHENHISTDESEITADQRAFLERMYSMYSATATTGEKLRDTYSREGAQSLDQAVEDLAYELMADNEEYKELLHQRELNRNAPIGPRVRELEAMYKDFIYSINDLPNETRYKQIEAARNNVKHILAESIEEPIDDPEKAIEVLGIKRKDSDGHISYHFPVELVPESVNEKWEVYLAAACANIIAEDNLRSSGNTDEIDATDSARVYAHNAVTDDIHAILNLDGIKGWDRARTRQLLATIRDNTFATFGSKNASSHETELANKLLAKYNDKQLAIVKALSSR